MTPADPDPKPRRRSPRRRHGDVANALRRDITSGRWPPGSRLPTKLDLCRILGASGGTVQRALRTLTAEGFLRAHGRLGTRVRADSPHVHRVALVLGGRAESSLWYSALARAAGVVAPTMGMSVVVHEDCHCDAAAGGAYSQGLRGLEEDVALGRLTGLILAASAPGLGTSQTRQRTGLPRVWLGNEKTAGQDPVIALEPAFPRALGLFASRSRKRLALFGTFHFADAVRRLTREAEAMNLSLEPLHTHLLHEHSTQPARGIARLMMALPRSRRPDAIFVADDHVAEHVLAGLSDAGVRAGPALDVVIMANFPRSTAALAVAQQDPGVIALGYDARAVLTASLRELASSREQQATGRNRSTSARIIRIAATFSHELPAAVEGRHQP